jgi:hypothetical protein
MHERLSLGVNNFAAMPAIFISTEILESGCTMCQPKASPPTFSGGTRRLNEADGRNTMRMLCSWRKNIRIAMDGFRMSMMPEHERAIPSTGADRRVTRQFLDTMTMTIASKRTAAVHRGLAENATHRGYLTLVSITHH